MAILNCFVFLKPVFFFDQDEIADIERFVKFIATALHGFSKNIFSPYGTMYLTLYFIMLQNGQTYFKNHAVFTP